MAKITGKCPQCGATLKASRDELGKKGRCSKCGAIVQVPFGAPVQGEAPEPATSSASEHQSHPFEARKQAQRQSLARSTNRGPEKPLLVVEAVTDGQSRQGTSPKAWKLGLTKQTPALLAGLAALVILGVAIVLLMLRAPRQSELPQTAKALDSLGKASVGFAVGISYLDFQPVLRDLALQVENSGSSQESSEVPLIAVHIVEGSTDYKLLNQIWREKVNLTMRRQMQIWRDEGISVPDGYVYLQDWEPFDERYDFPDTLHCDDNAPGIKPYVREADGCMQIIMEHASRHVEKAKELFLALRP